MAPGTPLYQWHPIKGTRRTKERSCMSWRSIEEYQEPLAIASRLDPVGSLPNNLGAYLRISQLLWGKLVVPEIFLLHNQSLLDRLKNSDERTDFECFMKVGAPIINRNSRPWNESFEGHWVKSAETNNPLLIPGDEGRGHAEYLDTVVTNDQCRCYASDTATRRYDDLFRETLKATFDDQALRKEGLARLSEFIWDPEHEGDTNIRGPVDGYTGLTRGSVLRAMKRMTKEAAFLRYVPNVAQAARHAYAKNVIDSLNRDPSNIAQVPLVSRSLLVTEPGYQICLDDDVAEDMVSKLISGGLSYSIDTTSLLQLPWDKIVEISTHEARKQFHEARSKAAQAASQNSIDKEVYAQEVDKMIEALNIYFMYIAEIVPSSGGQQYSGISLVLREYKLTPEHIVFAGAGYGISLLLGGWQGASVFASLESLYFSAKLKIGRKMDQTRESHRKSQIKDFLIR